MDTRGHIIVQTTGGPNPRVLSARLAPGPATDLSAYLDTGNTPVPEEMVQRMRQGLPQVRRRDSRERYRATLERVTRDAFAAYRRAGRIVWPKSVEDELKLIAWKNGDPGLLDLGGIDQLQRQIEAYVRHVVETGEMQQKANDRKKVALDWSGH